MALSIPTNELAFEELELGSEPSAPNLTTMEQGDTTAENEQLRLVRSSEPENNWIFPNADVLEVKECFTKITTLGFSIDSPWLPPNALKLINKIRKGAISESDLNHLMEIVADRSTAHFSLPKGQFVALAFNGKVVEVSNTRIGLLKKLQTQKNPGSFFVWRVGFKSFSGRQ